MLLCAVSCGDEPEIPDGAEFYVATAVTTVISAQGTTIGKEVNFYNEDGQIVYVEVYSMANADDDGTLVANKVFEYDANGNQSYSKYTNPDTGYSNEIITVTNEHGHVTSRTQTIVENGETTVTEYSCVFTYDSNDNVTKAVQTLDGETVELTYSYFENTKSYVLTGDDGTEARVMYNEDGTLFSKETADSYEKNTYIYDTLGRLTAHKVTGRWDDLVSSVRYTYDSYGNLIKKNTYDSTNTIVESIAYTYVFELPLYVADRMGDASDINIDKVFVTHAGCEPEIIELCVNKVKEIAPEANVMITRAGCTVSSHCGRNTLGVLFIRKAPI